MATSREKFLRRPKRRMRYRETHMATTVTIGGDSVTVSSGTLYSQPPN